jgi:hypothetical protein
LCIKLSEKCTALFYDKNPSGYKVQTRQERSELGFRDRLDRGFCCGSSPSLLPFCCAGPIPHARRLIRVTHVSSIETRHTGNDNASSFKPRLVWIVLVRLFASYERTPQPPHVVAYVTSTRLMTALSLRGSSSTCARLSSHGVALLPLRHECTTASR